MKSCYTFKASASKVLWMAVICCWITTLGVVAQAQTIPEAVAAIDECVQKLDKPLLTAPVAQALKMDVAFVEKALLQENCQVSDLVFLRALAKKTAVSPEAALSAHPQREWLAHLKKAGFSEEEILQLLDDAYADLALKMLDFPRKKENVKKTAKR
ncbi:hypothetical protein NXS98_07035 [Fontisphaera persica]|uniref:hypothetical protein n=1 Tax=Fontisphaera persica TaxID=2974023 RepID=UPI0024C02CDC|nr:hypothetical protein [Fontisphaera persica]WCJ60875.1 hypothetical protein NXS98_07035 [Fontisphaera persica]